MRLLLDTHMIFWALMAPGKLPDAARQLLEDPANEVYVSVASAWETAIKVGSGKWPEARPFIEEFELFITESGFEVLPISVQQVRRAGLMISDHRDPFDRLIAAQAIDLEFKVLSLDSEFASLGCELA